MKTVHARQQCDNGICNQVSIERAVLVRTLKKRKESFVREQSHQLESKQSARRSQHLNGNKVMSSFVFEAHRSGLHALKSEWDDLQLHMLKEAQS
jgi:hypothetical protein